METHMGFQKSASFFGCPDKRTIAFGKMNWEHVVGPQQWVGKGRFRFWQRNWGLWGLG